MTVPVFAAVGHPNKGKSSIVSALAHDDSVAVGPMPGTTVRCRRYPMTVDGKVLYVLVDTPGFQRARKALAWMRARETTAASHPEVVRAFLDAHRDNPAFANEVELLRPIMEGAGILYVVDGSVPYGSEYEAEMEILRWTGQPRMALVNPIGESDHVGEWSTALGQYFGMVRVFNAVMADFSRQVELLRAFGELREDWRRPLSEALGIITAERRTRRARAARFIAETISEMILFRVERKLDSAAPPEALRADLLARYREGLQALESRCRDRVEEIYDHRRLKRREEALELLDSDGLFSRETWSLFGLRKSQLVGFGALSGGAAGGLIDAALGGASFLLGAAVGAGIGATTAALAADRLVEVRVMNVPLGGEALVAGPTGNVNFPHVVFERARLHHRLVSDRSHARRGDLDTAAAVRELAPSSSALDARGLEKAFAALRKGRDPVAATEDLARVVEGILASDGPLP